MNVLDQKVIDNLHDVQFSMLLKVYNCVADYNMFTPYVAEVEFTHNKAYWYKYINNKCRCTLKTRGSSGNYFWNVYHVEKYSYKKLCSIKTIYVVPSDKANNNMF